LFAAVIYFYLLFVEETKFRFAEGCF